MSHAEIFSLFPDEGDTKSRKRHVDDHDIYKINTHLAVQREKHMVQDQKPITAEAITFDVPSQKENEIRTIPWKQNTCGQVN